MSLRAELIPIGTPAPDFSATLSDGTQFSLAAQRGKRVLLVFYPGDDTPVCTGQLCALRDRWQELQSQDILVYGVNPASREKHARFAARYNFPFPLLVDEGSHIAALYGCRMLLGLMVRRTVYGIDRRGHIFFARRGNPSPQEILAALPDERDALPINRAEPGKS